MLKKLCNLFLPIALFFSLLCACQQSDSNKKSLNTWMTHSERIKVLSTTAQIGDLVQEIGGERIDSWVLIQGMLDPHSYELVKGDGEKLQRADLIFYNGLGLEHGASLSTWLSSNQKAISLGERILKNQPDRLLHKGNAIDPHIWMDISLWKETVKGITEALIAADPEGTIAYQNRASVLLTHMEEVDSELRVLLHRIPQEKRYLVTSHDAFQYFTRSYLAEEGERNWDARVEAPEGLAPDGQLSPVDIQRIIAYLQQHKISILFPESNVSRDSIRKISSAGRELGLKVRVCPEALYGDAMDRLHYLDMMRHNAATIARYLEEDS